MPEPFSDRRGPMAPPIVTARPPRIQTVPTATLTIQCQRDQGRRSSRAGMLVSIVRSVAASESAIWVPSPQRSEILRLSFARVQRAKTRSGGDRVCPFDAGAGDALGGRLIVGPA